MKGRYFLEIKSRKVFYQLDIERKVTVIKGNSGTGKTSLIRMISDYVELGKDSGVHIQKSGEYDIKVFENRTDWAQELERVHDTIIFVDEDVRYLYEKNFQLLFQTADCYIVIVSRSGMFRQLPYAIASVYELRTQKDGKTFITRLYRIYEEKLQEVKANYVITEDSNAGYEMMQDIFTCPVESAKGNGNVLNELSKKIMSYENIFVIVDGAAFGGYIAAVLKIAGIRENVTVIAPESFEYLLLKANAFRRFLADELEHTWKYCDSKKHMTWERYFTELLGDLTVQKYGFHYSKKKLNPFFLNETYKKQVEGELTDVVHEIP